MRCRVLLVLLLCALPAVPQATVVVPAEFREVVNGADVIAYGRVVETTVETGDARRRVDTLVTLRVGTYLKGGPGDTLVFRVPGGQVGRYRTVLVGAPQFAVGDEVIVFLNTAAREYPTVFGLNQGVFRVEVEAQTRRRVVMPTAVMAQADEPERVVRGAPSRRPVPLETFGAQVQTVLAERSRRGQQ